jgi:hypothetical protein
MNSASNAALKGIAVKFIKGTIKAGKNPSENGSLKNFDDYSEENENKVEEKCSSVTCKKKGKFNCIHKYEL